VRLFHGTERTLWARAAVSDSVEADPPSLVLLGLNHGNRRHIHSDLDRPDVRLPLREQVRERIAALHRWVRTFSFRDNVSLLLSAI
jgi:hypothetical protein